MTSSTAPSRPDPRLTVLSAAIAVAAAAAVHLVMEPLAARAEAHSGAFLWKAEEWLQVFTPARYVGRGAGRMLVYGPSETREAFLPDAIETALPGTECLQNAQSMGTIEDGILLLRYLEREYGPDAVPSELLLGLSTRFVSNVLARGEDSYLMSSIDRYGPHLRVDRTSAPPDLAPKPPFEQFLSTIRFRLRQQRRYQGALKVALRDALEAAGSPMADHPRLRQILSPAKYHGFPRVPERETQEWLADPTGFWWDVHQWDPDADRERVLRDFRTLLAFCRERGVKVYAVNMPEVSWNRDLYAPGRYDRYLALVREGLGDTPFLDLRLQLADEEFFDACHPTLEGCKRVSDAVTKFLVRARADAEKGPR